MELYLLYDDALNDLKYNIKNNLDKYNSSLPFLETYFSGKQYRYPLEININLPKLIINDDLPKWEQDFENSKILYESISNKVPLRYLLDERFWSYLTHTYYWEYVTNRWPAKDEKRVNEKWFFSNGSQVFSRQSLVRLWWIPTITYDEKFKDPYELTKIAFEFQDPFNQIIERKISKSNKVVKAALRAIRDVDGSQQLKSDSNRTKFGKAINTIAGVKLLDALSEDELYDMFCNEIKNIIENK